MPQNIGPIYDPSADRGVKPQSYTQDVSRNYPPKRGFSLTPYGYAADGTQVPSEYLIKISSFRLGVTIRGLMQEDIQMRVASQWVPIVPTNASVIGNIITQLATQGKKSLVSKAASRRIWVGTSPMEISLLLKFEAINDGWTEVTEPLRLLQSMAAASEPSGTDDSPSTVAINEIKSFEDAVSKLPTLGPPGPSPFTIDDLLTHRKIDKYISEGKKVTEGLKGGDIIILEIGNFVTFYSVIVSQVNVVVPPRWIPGGDPASAAVRVVFETYEMPTVESLQYSYKKTGIEYRL